MIFGAITVIFTYTKYIPGVLYIAVFIYSTYIELTFDFVKHDHVSCQELRQIVVGASGRVKDRDL